MPDATLLDEFSSGKNATAEELRFRLPRAGADYLRGAFENPRLDGKNLVLMLANGSLPAALIQKIAAQKRFLALYEVRRGIVLHRQAPRVLKMNLAHFLRWRDLARLSEDPRTDPPVRKAAETLLKGRVAEMALGERIALARIASPGVISALRSDPHPEVIATLLGNGRVTEEDALVIVSGERTPAQVLASVARSPRWRERYPVKVALLRNPRTPAAASLPFLETLSSKDLKEVISSTQAPRLVKATARQILKSRTGSEFVDRKGALT